MNFEYQTLPDHLTRFHFTVVGGFAHGWRIPHSNGLCGIRFAEEGRLIKGYDHVAHLFQVLETGAYLVVFAPSNLASGLVADFLNGKMSEEDMKAFSVEKGVFEVSGVAAKGKSK